MKRKKRMEDAIRWLLQSEKDLDDAQFNLSGKRYNVCCFLAQQSAEKILKAYLFKKGERSVWGHSVADLCDLALRYDRNFERLFSIAGQLDMYYIPTRYPDGIPEGIPSNVFLEEDAKHAIELAEEIADFIKTRVNFLK